MILPFTSLGRLIMQTYRCFYSRKAFDNLKKYIFSNYPTQPLVMSIDSMYCFVSNLDGKRTTTNLHVLEITKIDTIPKIRLLENDRSIGAWNKIESVNLQGLDLNTLIIGANALTIRVDNSLLMDSCMQTIRFFGFPEA